MSSTFSAAPIGSRALTAFLAAGVSASFLGVCLACAFANWPLNGAFGVAAVLCAIGTPVAAVLAWANAAIALGPEPPKLRTRLKHSATGVFLGLLAFAAGSALASTPRLGLGAQPSDIALGVGFALVLGGMLSGLFAFWGLVGLGLPALLYGVLVETIWLRLVRRLPMRPAPRPETEPLVVKPLPRGSVALAMAAVTLSGTGVMPGIIQLARSNDPPGILYGALLVWFLTLLAPGLIVLAALRRRSWRLLVAAVPALLAIAFIVEAPTGLVDVLAAIALAVAALTARGRDRMAPLASVLVAVLLLAAPVVQQATTEKVCWDIYDDGLEMRLTPRQPNGPMEAPILSTGCLDRSFSGSGAALGAVMLVLAGAAAAGDSGKSFDRP